MSDLSQASTDELVAELERRQAVPRCPCGKWRTFAGIYDQDGYTWRCYGCLRATTRCTCR